MLLSWLDGQAAIDAEERRRRREEAARRPASPEEFPWLIEQPEGWFGLTPETKEQPRAQPDESALPEMHQLRNLMNQRRMVDTTGEYNGKIQVCEGQDPLKASPAKSAAHLSGAVQTPLSPSPPASARMRSPINKQQMELLGERTEYRGRASRASTNSRPSTAHSRASAEKVQCSLHEGNDSVQCPLNQYTGRASRASVRSRGSSVQSRPSTAVSRVSEGSAAKARLEIHQTLEIQRVLESAPPVGAQLSTSPIRQRSPTHRHPDGVVIGERIEYNGLFSRSSPRPRPCTARAGSSNTSQQAGYNRRASKSSPRPRPCTARARSSNASQQAGYNRRPSKSSPRPCTAKTRSSNASEKGRNVAERAGGESKVILMKYSGSVNRASSCSRPRTAKVRSNPSLYATHNGRVTTNPSRTRPHTAKVCSSAAVLSTAQRAAVSHGSHLTPYF